MRTHALLAYLEATAPHIIKQAWKASGCWPINAARVLTSENFPELGYEDFIAPTPAKRKRKGFRISNRLLTADDALNEMRAANGATKTVAKKPAKNTEPADQ